MIPDDPARTAPPGELWNDESVEDFPPDSVDEDDICWDESGVTSGAGAGR
jgi:hypothetical protein